MSADADMERYIDTLVCFQLEMSLWIKA